MTETLMTTKNELLAHALQMEQEAEERYRFLSDLMKQHNNMDLAKLFTKLSWIEGLHAKEIAEQMAGSDVPELMHHEFKWVSGESPEALDLGEVDYLMTPRQALDLAHKAEVNACRFFCEIRDTTADPEIKELATEYAEEEAEHVELIEAELKKYPESEYPWRDDMDEAQSQD